MRRRLIRILTCLAPLMCTGILTFLLAFALPSQYSGTFLGGFAGKVAYLHETEGPRIILCGGSGAAFALRCDLLEGELPGFRAVNLGMYAGLGSTVPLSAAVDECRENDIVIFMPEQNPQTLSLYFGPQAMWQAADGHFELLRLIREDQWPQMLAQFPYFAAQKAQYFFTGTSPSGDGIYTADAFNRWGDIESTLRDSNIMPEGKDANMLISFGPKDLPDDFAGYINQCAAICAGKDAQLCFAFCPMNRAAVDPEGIDAYVQHLRDVLTCPVLGSPQDSILDSGWFYDTNFHLNSAGAVLYTAKLASLLRQETGLSAEVSIPLPDMPGAFHTEKGFTGDDSDADMFLYETVSGGVNITGLTEEGASRESLVLPGTWGGRPVLGISASALSGNRVVRSVTVQENIRLIPDGAFDGCSSLQEIILSGMKPSDITVGSRLLDGTGAMILVPMEEVSSFVTSYFWAQYANRIRGYAAPAESPENGKDDPAPQDDVQNAALESPALVRYDANGGAGPDGGTVLEVPIDDTHLRMNALNATDSFTRPGHILLGWNTRADGSGKQIGLGSRFTPENGLTLYALWARETDADAFDYTERNQTIWITGYHGTGEMCVIPSQIRGMPVQGIASGAFRDAGMHTLVVPPTVQVVEAEALQCCSLEVLYLYDSLTEISDASFTDCSCLRTLHVNAAVPPVYSISYYASFADKYDWLLSLSGQKKLVLFSGSSTRYGYDSAMLHRHFPAYQVANMGVYAYTNALPQMELILPLMEEGDVLLHAPEFDCLNFQMCENNRIDIHFWAMMEANYDCISALDLTKFSGTFDSMKTYLTIRSSMPERTYSDSPNGYDDDGNNMNTPTYNQYGDFIMPRPNNKMDVMLKYVRPEYTVAPFTPERMESINREYRHFQDRGILVLFTFTPRNRSSISEDSTPENRKELERYLKEQLCVPVISKMENSLMSGIYFYVIDSHLSNEGARLFTLQIVEDLAPWLQTSPGDT